LVDSRAEDGVRSDIQTSKGDVIDFAEIGLKIDCIHIKLEV